MGAAPPGRRPRAGGTPSSAPTARAPCWPGSPGRRDAHQEVERTRGRDRVARVVLDGRRARRRRRVQVRALHACLHVVATAEGVAVLRGEQRRLRGPVGLLQQLRGGTRRRGGDRRAGRSATRGGRCSCRYSRHTMASSTLLTSSRSVLNFTMDATRSFGASSRSYTVAADNDSTTASAKTRSWSQRTHTARRATRGARRHAAVGPSAGVLRRRRAWCRVGPTRTGDAQTTSSLAKCLACFTGRRPAAVSASSARR